MPINQKAMANMKKEYGDEKGERVYYASVNTGKVKESLGRFARNLKKRHGKKGQAVAEPNWDLIQNAMARTLENYARVFAMLLLVIANPTQANIDALLALAVAGGVIQPKPTYSVDGESYDWGGYQRDLGKIMSDVKDQLIYAQGPFEVRSRTGF